MEDDEAIGAEVDRGVGVAEGEAVGPELVEGTGVLVGSGVIVGAE